MHRYRNKRHSGRANVETTIGQMALTFLVSGYGNPGTYKKKGGFFNEIKASRVEDFILFLRHKRNLKPSTMESKVQHLQVGLLVFYVEKTSCVTFFCFRLSLPKVSIYSWRSSTLRIRQLRSKASSMNLCGIFPKLKIGSRLWWARPGKISIESHVSCAYVITFTASSTYMLYINRRECAHYASKKLMSLREQYEEVSFGQA